MRLVLLGAPGSGKGTQAQKLVSDRGIPQISTGDLLRGAVASGSELGASARSVMAAGELVADDIVLGIIRERLTRPDTAGGFILDGFPRNTAQAEALSLLLAEIQQPLDAAVLLHVDQEVLFRRLTGRRTCDRCGHVCNVYFSPPSEDGVCDQCRGKLIQRADDNEDTIQHRLEVYRSQTEPLIHYYDAAGLLRRIDADGTVGEVYRRLSAVLEAPR